MYAERLILETDKSGHIKNIPILPANKQVEVIFLVLEENKKVINRQPHPDIAGKVIINEEIFDSSPTSDWDSH